MVVNRPCAHKFRGYVEPKEPLISTMFTTIPENETWLSTREAARALGISEWSLRRYANADTGFLLEGKHFKKGRYRTSKTAWHMEQVKEAMENQGYLFFSDNK